MAGTQVCGMKEPENAQLSEYHRTTGVSRGGARDLPMLGLGLVKQPTALVEMQNPEAYVYSARESPSDIKSI